MLFEGVVTSIENHLYTVRELRYGEIYSDCKLCTTGNVDWTIEEGDYVLCARSENGSAYILGEIKGSPPTQYGVRIGADNDDNCLIITKEGSLLHQKESCTILVNEEKFSVFNIVIEHETLGARILITQDNIKIETNTKTEVRSGSKIVAGVSNREIEITSDGIKLCGDNSGGILKGNETQQKIDEIINTINNLIAAFNTHTHSGAGTPTEPPFSALLSTSNLQSDVVKSS